MKIVDYREQLTKDLDLINKAYRFSEVCANINGHAPIDWTDKDIFEIVYSLCRFVFNVDITENVRIREYSDPNFESIVISNINDLYDTVILPKIKHCVEIIEYMNKNNIKDILVTDENQIFEDILIGLKHILNYNSDIIDKFYGIYDSKYYIKYTDEELNNIKNTLLIIRDELIDYVNELELPTE